MTEPRPRTEAPRAAAPSAGAPSAGVSRTGESHAGAPLAMPLAAGPSPTQAPRVTLVVARARNGTIGRDNALPWHLPEDLKHFRATTTGHAVVMGRRTYESIGRPLPNRRNLVISRTPGFAPEGVEVLPSLEAALARCAGLPEAFVIGGAQLYREALGRADRAIVTEIDADFDGDAHFDALDPVQWQAVARRDETGANGLPFAVVTYERRR